MSYRNEGKKKVVVIHEGGSALKWLVVGAAVGGALALLFAPQSGEATRRDLSRRLRGLRRAAEARFNDIGDALTAKEQKLREMAENAFGGDADEDEDEEDAPRAGGKERGVAATPRQELERRLADARARRRPLPTEEEEPVA